VEVTFAFAVFEIFCKTLVNFGKFLSLNTRVMAKDIKSILQLPMAVTNTPAYCDTKLLTTMRSFV
jgi:hypothetical protein